MNQEPLSVLLVEDNVADRVLVREMVHQARSVMIKLMECERLSDAKHVLATHITDCILLDLSLPDASGLEAVGEIVSVRRRMCRSSCSRATTTRRRRSRPSRAAPKTTC